MTSLRLARVWVLLGVAFLVRVAYTFLACGDIHSLLYSDAGGYWARALQRFHGVESDYGQWAIWAPCYHYLLSGLFALLNALFVSESAFLPIVLVFHAALGALSCWWLVDLVWSATGDEKAGWLTGWLYAFSFPLVYLGAFVLSENVALPLLIWALRELVVAWDRRAFVLAGLALGLALALRPAMILIGLVALTWLWRQRGPVKTVWCLVGLLAVWGVVCTENARISGGLVRGLAAGAGANFCIAQAKFRDVHSIYLMPNGGKYEIVVESPGLGNNPAYGSWGATVPFFDQGYWFRTGFRFLRAEPARLIAGDFAELRRLWWGGWYPSSATLGFASFERIVPLFGFFQVLPLITLPIWAFAGEKVRPGVWLLWWVAVSIVPMGLVFGTERRYGYGVEFADLALLSYFLRQVNWVPVWAWGRRALLAHFADELNWLDARLWRRRCWWGLAGRRGA